MLVERGIKAGTHRLGSDACKRLRSAGACRRLIAKDGEWHDAERSQCLREVK
jgi:hypothetical protein